MADRPWYRRNPSEYISHTIHLSFLEDAVYNRLLDWYWINGPIPADLKSQMDVIRAPNRRSIGVRKALDRCLNGFFFVSADGRFHNKRMDAEIAEVNELIQKRRLAGQAGGQASAEARAQASGGSPYAQASQKPDLLERGCAPSAHPRGAEDMDPVTTEKGKFSPPRASPGAARGSENSLEANGEKRASKTGAKPWPSTAAKSTQAEREDREQRRAEWEALTGTKSALRERGLSTDGTAEELRARLTQAMVAEAQERVGGMKRKRANGE